MLDSWTSQPPRLTPWALDVRQSMDWAGVRRRLLKARRVQNRILDSPYTVTHQDRSVRLGSDRLYVHIEYKVLHSLISQTTDILHRGRSGRSGLKLGISDGQSNIPESILRRIPQGILVADESLLQKGIIGHRTACMLGQDNGGQMTSRGVLKICNGCLNPDTYSLLRTPTSRHCPYHLGTRVICLSRV